MTTVAAVRTRALAVPAWAWLAAIVGVSAAVRIVLARQVVAPWIMVDELIYSELAKSFAAHGHFLLRGVPSTGYGFVYPVLIAPAWRVFGPVPTAYAAAKDIDSVLMSLAALPAYGLARRLLPRPHSLAAAALAVLVPSMLYTGELMTENAFYPLFLAVCLVLVVTLETPGWRRQVGLLALCGLAYATRAQAIALVPAVLAAPILHGLIERDLRTRLRRFVPLYAIVGAAVALALLASAARGRSPLSLLGAYRVATGAGYSAGTVAHYVLWHVAELDLYVGILPFAALLGLWLAPRVASPGARAFAAATLPVTVLLVVEVAAFASTQSFRIEERNMFYVAPFGLVALLALTVDGAAPRRRALVVGAAVAGVLPLAIDYARFVGLSAVSDTFALLPWWWLQDRGIHFHAIRWLSLGVGLLAAAVLVALPRRALVALPLVVAVYFALTTAVVLEGRHGIRDTAAADLHAGIRQAHPDWIDRIAGRGANVALLWPVQPEVHPVWENEFFNRSVGTVYALGADPWGGGLPETVVHVRADGRVASGDTPVPPVQYALVPTDVAGQRLAADPEIGLSLYKVNGPLVVLTRVDGVDSDTWGGRYVSYRRFDCHGGHLTVTLASDLKLFAVPNRIAVRQFGRLTTTIHLDPRTTPQSPLVVRIPLRPRRGVCRVSFVAAFTSVPATHEPGSTDRRRLAAHYQSFVYSP